MGNKIYYILDIDSRTFDGPYTFKEAFKKQGNYWWPTMVVKVVVDKYGKEVK